MSTHSDEGLPLLDPQRELCGLLGTGSGKHRRERDATSTAEAFAEVRERVAAERLWKAEPAPGHGREPLDALPALAALDPRSEPVLRARAETAVACLQLLVRRYQDDEELRDFLAVPPVLRRWVLDQPDPAGLSVDLCRLDLLGDTLGTVRVLEFNASCPGGVLSAGMLNRFWRESSLSPLLEEWALPEAPIERPTWFADWLLRYGLSHGLAEEETHRVGLFRPPHGTTFEFGLMTDQLRALGRKVVELDPADPEPARGVRLGYLKYIPVDARPAAEWDTFCDRVRRGDLAVPNVPGERWVAENKLCLAALSDPRFRRLFTDPQRATLDALVPYSRKLGDGITEDEAVRERALLVLKAPYSCRGQSVLIGADTAPEEWERAVRDPARKGWLVQEKVSTPALETAEGPYFRDLVVPVLEGRVIGYGSRMSHGHLLNTARGGGTPVLFAPHPLT
ncbi:hypothetical protein [Streptomyces iconiensis]|uniref:Glutathionylspermidine synthase n=1 Tax=Streptomyces iconiensis TaxID=1384038 RepID=A0ABT6ZRD8_9ACTN|nr:hypothetical protein [Streptomyces iconiensis]MDJ1131631.1 hypothetical protein [Streptomyces iconiensis]